jgi:hypothetical protein
MDAASPPQGTGKSAFRGLVGFISFLLFAHFVQVLLMGAPDLFSGKDRMLTPETTPFPFWLYASPVGLGALGTAYLCFRWKRLPKNLSPIVARTVQSQKQAVQAPMIVIIVLGFLVQFLPHGYAFLVMVGALVGIVAGLIPQHLAKTHSPRFAKASFWICFVSGIVLIFWVPPILSAILSVTALVMGKQSTESV